MQRYREIVRQTILKYTQFQPSYGHIRLDPVFDDLHNRYALMQVGWNRGRRVRGNLISVTLQEGKVYIEHDGLEQGVSPEHIVLAFQAKQAA